MAERCDFHDIGWLPVRGDNVAIATRRLEGGTTIRHESGEFAVNQGAVPVQPISLIEFLE